MIPFKEVAMLTSGLLARKGSAIPASLGLAPYAHAAPPGAPAPTAAPPLAPTAALRSVQPTSAALPPRVDSWPPLPFPTARAPQRPAPEAKVVAPEPAPAVDAPAVEALPADGKLAKVSLRLDPKRHLKLRLAAAHQRRSGQQILLAALDAYVDGIAAGVAGGDCVCLKRNAAT
jgi:hypothetical protein